MYNDNQNDIYNNNDNNNCVYSSEAEHKIQVLH